MEWVRQFPWRRDRLPTPVFLGFPSGSDRKETSCNARDLGLIPDLGRSPGGGHSNPLHYSCLENSHGHRSPAGYNPWGLKELDTTEQLSIAHYANAKSLLSCPTLCDHIDSSPPGSPVPGILQARTLEWVAISFSEFRSSEVII